MLDGAGALTIRNLWVKAGWSDSHSGLTGTITDNGGHVNGTTPGFVDFASQDFHLAAASGAVDAGAALAAAVLPNYDVDEQYVAHLSSQGRAAISTLDIGAFEYGVVAPPPPPAPPVPPITPGEDGGGSSGCGLVGIEPVLLLALMAWISRRRPAPERSQEQAPER